MAVREAPKSSQMSPYRVCVVPRHIEDELWDELDEALATSLLDPAWARQQAVWVLQDATLFGCRELVRACEALLTVLHR